MITVDVVPEFSSVYPFLRARACWLFGECFDIEYENPSTFLHGLQQVLNLTKDEHLPVRLKAANSLRFLCQNQLAVQPLRSVLPQLLEMFFGLMNEIENDDLVKSLEMTIQCFAQDIAPYANTLIQKLVETFLRFSTTGDDEDEGAVMAAMECLNAIETILFSITKHPHLYQQAEPLLIPLLVHLFNDDAMEFMEEALKILAHLTFYTPSISPALWQVFPLLYKAFLEWASDWMDQMIIPLDNYISRGNDVFLSNPDYLKMILSMYHKLMGDTGVEEIDAGEGAQLIEVVLQHCRGRIDEFVPGILELAIKRLLALETQKKSLKVLCLEVVANALWYNSALTLQAMDAKGFMAQTFQSFYENSPHFKRLKDKKLAIVGLSCIFGVPFGSLPTTLQPALGSVFMLLLKFLHLHEMQKTNPKEKVNQGESDGEESDSVGEEEEDEDDDDEEEEEEEENDLLVPENEDVGEGGDTLVGLAEAASEISFSMKHDDELVGGIVTSPLDDIEPYSFFAQHMEAFSQRDKEVYAKMMEALEGEQCLFYRAILQKATQQAQIKH